MMGRRVGTALSLLPLLATFLPVQGQDLSPVTEVKISQSGAPILWGADIAIGEDGVIFITDANDGNIKCYDPEGKLLLIIGRRGPGPDEFGGPSFCDYQAPFLSVLDTTKFKVHIYERKGRTNFVKVAEINCMMCSSDVILSGKGVLVDAVAYNNGKKYFLTLRDFPKEFVRYLLPVERRYGFESERAYKANYPDISMLTAQRGFLSIMGERAYFVFDIRPIVTSVNLDGSVITTFGSPSPNYREPRINQTIRNGFADPSGEGKIITERNKVSYITGILSDKDMVGVLFSNYDPPSSIWRLYLQRYDTAGKFVSEVLLRDAVNYDSLFNYYFQRESGVLYVMSERYGDELDDYQVLGYKLR